MILIDLFFNAVRILKDPSLVGLLLFLARSLVLTVQEAMTLTMMVGSQGKAKGTPTGCGQGHLPGGRQYSGTGCSAKPGWLNKDTPRDWEED